MKYKVRRGKNGFVNYYEITTFSRILNILASGIFYIFDVLFHYILMMPFIISWYLIYIIYFSDAGLSSLMENMKDGVGMCLVLNLPTACLYVAYKTWRDYKSDTITSP
ncbi:hypothetical protein HMPREF1144_0014 [Klebsiella sp. OBRC7]|jgi:hypothetical protein|nr:hypothetical protein HMPREF1144_0014 [Klebsiella sp. OBRC7]KAF0858808.1 hypothetical protein Y888_15400 [Mixta calida B021323]PLI15347.1 hypothetical protein B6J42_26305 [Klebsiella pneumoniae]PLI21715.1 hypothetical protein B6J43_22575 [Klebsiella pneumoniae]SWZ48661.1 Uncharacterised protein [Klebsiella pneumoniae]